MGFAKPMNLQQMLHRAMPGTGPQAVRDNAGGPEKEKPCRNILILPDWDAYFPN